MPDKPNTSQTSESKSTPEPTPEQEATGNLDVKAIQSELQAEKERSAALEKDRNSALEKAERAEKEKNDTIKNTKSIRNSDDIAPGIHKDYTFKGSYRNAFKDNVYKKLVISTRDRKRAEMRGNYQKVINEQQPRG